MGTRSLTHIHDEEGETLLTFYRQFDGYPSGLGRELAEFLAGYKIVNGFSGDEGAKAANGMGCLAAQVIAKFKDKIGNVYIQKTGAKDCGEEFVYRIKRGPEDKMPAGRSGYQKEFWGLVFTCEEPDGKEIWSGAPEKFAEYLAAEEANA